MTIPVGGYLAFTAQQIGDLSGKVNCGMEALMYNSRHFLRAPKKAS